MDIKNIIKKIYYRNKYRNIKLKKGSKVGGFNSSFEGNNVIGENSFFSGRIGFGSYMGSGCTFYGQIGRYCSISDDVKVIVGSHPTSKFISTHPAFFSLKKQAGFTYVDEQKYDESKYSQNNCFVTVGNDVWIGYGARILSGITIHDGAIIAAGAVVTKDVPAYSVVGGIPAKVVKNRFSDEQIIKLEKLKWWNKPQEWIENNSDYFEDINQYLDLLLQK